MISSLIAVFCIALAMTPGQAQAGLFDGLIRAVTSALSGQSRPSKSNTAATDENTQSDNSIASETSSTSQPASPPQSGALTTADSSILITGDFSADTRLVNIEILQSDPSATPDLIYVSLPSGGHFEKTVYLLHGEGNYTIHIFSSLNPDRFQKPAGLVYYKSEQVTNTDTRDNSFSLPTGDVQSDDPAIVALANSLVDPSMDELAKAKSLHDWITSNIQYDATSYFSNSYLNKVYDASSALKTHVSICYGYSNLFAAMARVVGLRAKVINGAIIWPQLGQSWAVQGTTQVHAWNEVLVNGQWITLDTTWDAGYMNFTTQTFTQSPHSNYFNPEAAAFALDHKKISEDPNN